MNKTTIRILLDIVIAIAVLEGWWFVALPIGIVSAWAFPYYLELFLAGFIYDSLFGMTTGMGIVGYLGTIVTAIVLAIVAIVKKLVR